MNCIHETYWTLPIGLLLDEIVLWIWTLFNCHAWPREYVEACRGRYLAHVIAVIPSVDVDDAHGVSLLRESRQK